MLDCCTIVAVNLHNALELIVHRSVIVGTLTLHVHAPKYDTGQNKLLWWLCMSVRCPLGFSLVNESGDGVQTFCRQSEGLAMRDWTQWFPILVQCPAEFNLSQDDSNNLEDHDYLSSVMTTLGVHGNYNVNVFGLGRKDMLPRLATTNISTTYCCEHVRNTAAKHIT